MSFSPGDFQGVVFFDGRAALEPRHRRVFVVVVVVRVALVRVEVEKAAAEVLADGEKHRRRHLMTLKVRVTPRFEPRPAKWQVCTEPEGFAASSIYFFNFHVKLAYGLVILHTAYVWLFLYPLIYFLQTLSYEATVAYKKRATLQFYYLWW